MFQHKTEGMTRYTSQTQEKPEDKIVPTFFSKASFDDNIPALIHFSSTPLFRLEKTPEKYAHLLKKKDQENIVPIVNYFINKSGYVAYLGGDVVKNLYLCGRRRYKAINLLAILTCSDVDKYSCIMNNIISSNDGEFSLGFKYRVRKNRTEGCFKDIAQARYLIEPRLEGPEKLLFPFRPATIELDLTTENRFSDFFGIDAA